MPGDLLFSIDISAFFNSHSVIAPLQDSRAVLDSVRIEVLRRIFCAIGSVSSAV